MEQTAQASKQTRPAKMATTRQGPGTTGQAILLVGALATASLVTVALAGARPGLGEADLASVAADELEAATRSLYSTEAFDRIADAKSCKMPLAAITLSKSANAAFGDTLRIRSGTYLSPAFTVTSVAQRVAIPYPAPYAAGHGVLLILGEGGGYAVGLNPVQHLAVLSGSQAINVHWQPRTPC